MNEKLIVKNFGPIREAELDLKKVTVFIGPQGSGKSTLAKLVAICKDSDFLINTHVGRNSNISFRKYQADFFLNKNTSIVYKTESYSARIKTNSELVVETDIEIIKDFKSSFFNDFYSPMYFSELKNESKNVDDINDTNRHIFFEPILTNFKNKFTVKTKYLPTDRLLVSSISDSILGLLSAEVALQKSTTEFGNYFEISRSNIPNLFIDYLNITYKYENGRNLVFHNETDSVPLSASASGYQSVIPLHLTIEHFAKEIGRAHV